MSPDNTSGYGGLLPSSIALKVIGHSSDDFDLFVIGIVLRHVPDLNREAIGIRTSRDGNYMSVIVEIEPKTREQLDAVYKDLVSYERVIMVL